ncbi:MAG: Ribose-5-phosphate isomerase B [Candidatus Kaiserbacteria bacterium GW2011_GWA2_49_19]|uniref:Ribose-5-phosphate isomerase B n=1 Tax=Candidatus Kaiserbacteria bacterium GW2011_GWA2_49_19 TaxID=1618669 RepID=A0A0G1VSN4_9BACT|nr:MAG: Ribose-5-phosphate isomerase B [Candidatus Kaiserbacteria bacterium GW2011_GWA2_49_19]
MKIYFAGDHAGFELKKVLMEYVKKLGNEVEDMGPFALNPDDDFPDFVIPLAKKVAENTPLDPPSKEGGEVRGVICAGSGQGEVMAANRIRGIRAAVYYGGRADIVKVTREHNNANVLSLGARFMTAEEAKIAVKTFLDTPFSNDERHVRRLKKIDDITK